MEACHVMAQSLPWAQNPMCIITADAHNSGNLLGSDVFYYINYDARYEIQNGVVRVSY